MINHKLCPTCKPYGECLFVKLADLTVKNVPPVEKQTRIFTDPFGRYDKVTEEVASAHLEISHLRDIAKEAECANPDYDPYYRGKKNL